MDESQCQALDQKLSESFLLTPYLGCNITIISDCWGTWHGHTGYSNPKTRQPIGSHQQFYLYSITKTYTAALLLFNHICS